jgi:indole-3-glycerol phosphate synthase
VILNEIVKYKREYIAEAKIRRPMRDLIDSAESALSAERRSLASAIKSHEIAIIAEIKRRSPSGGDMGHSFGLAELARIYGQSGVVGISVLTDEKYFGGRPQDIFEVKEAVGLPILRKDFIIDEYQIYEAKAYGADVILLIEAILGDEEISRFLSLAHGLGLEVLVESHTGDELKRAIDSGAKLLGINNRNLDTLKTDLNTSVDLLKMVPDDRIAISESGISSSSDIKRLLDAGADGFLIGESLLKSGDPGKKLAELLNAKNSTV